MFEVRKFLEDSEAWTPAKLGSNLGGDATRIQYFIIAVNHWPLGEPSLVFHSYNLTKFFPTFQSALLESMVSWHYCTDGHVLTHQSCFKSCSSRLWMGSVLPSLGSLGELYREDGRLPVGWKGCLALDPPYSLMEDVNHPILLVTYSPSCIKIDLQNYKCALSNQLSCPNLKLGSF